MSEKQTPKTLGQVVTKSWADSKRRVYNKQQKREIVSDRLKLLRVTKKLTQRELCEKIDVIPTTYASYEQGKSEIPLATIVNICDFYDVSADYVLGRTEDIKGMYANEGKAEIEERLSKLEERLSKL